MLKFDNESSKIAGVSEEGVYLVNQEDIDSFRDKSLSPSLITSLEGCHARLAADKFIVPAIQPEAPVAAARGSAFHKVMELFYGKPAEERTKPELKKVILEVVHSDEFNDFFAKDTEHSKWLLDAVKGYYRIANDPKDDEVAELSIYGKKPRKGLEIFVKDSLGSSSREVLGFIDRVLVDKDNADYVMVEDYKTGAKAKRWNPKTKNTEGLAEARQQTIYTMLLEKEGVKVSQSSLIFPVAGETVGVNIHSSSLRERVIEDVNKADETLDEIVDENLFSYSPSFLCAWCPLAKICPEAKIIGRSEKVLNAYNSQPTPSELITVLE